MAARVQLKLDTEFDTFTTELLDQLLPNFMAPTPSALMVQADPTYADDALERGTVFPPGSYLDARYVDRDQRIILLLRVAHHRGQGACNNVAPGEAGRGADL